MPTKSISLLIAPIVRSSTPTRPPGAAELRARSRCGSICPLTTTRSQQLLGEGEQFCAVLVLVGVILPDGLGERLPFRERRVVEVGDLGPRFRIDGGHGLVVGLGAV